MTDFNVRTRIRELLDTTDLADPDELAGKLLADLTDAEKAVAFEQTANIVCSVIVTRDRMNPPPIQETPTAGTRKSSRATLVREWWREELRKRYVGVDGWTTLGQFTQADHEFAAAERRARAAAITANAEWHEACASAMAEAHVEAFEELSAEVLADLIARRRPE